MADTNGYYSLIQFCPDRARAETINVGVALFCPEQAFLDSKFCGSNKKIKNVFGFEGYDISRINETKKNVQLRIKKEAAYIKNKSDFARFAGSLGNELLMTAPRHLLTENPEIELGSLFNELVGGKPKKPHAPPASPGLDECFQELSAQHRAKLRHPVVVPKLEITIEVPYAYKNGKWNYVKPQKFQRSDPAMRLAVEGDLLRKYADNANLIVIPSFEDSQIKSSVLYLFKEYNVETVLEDEIDDFIARVKKEAHAS
ncbi:MAG: DUF3037 domain-containing protein [Planctomycetes bacterium]|nr:DUF3037 domain-containing protein [Planctomycetota bacterium]